MIDDPHNPEQINQEPIKKTNIFTIIFIVIAIIAILISIYCFLFLDLKWPAICTFLAICLINYIVANREYIAEKDKEDVHYDDENKPKE